MAEKKKSELFDWVKALLIAFGIAFIVRLFFFAPIVVDGPSMAPTLTDSDQMIVNKFIYNVSEPERFDIIVFHASARQDFIKRVIGVPGEHVAVEDNVLYINGEPVEEPFMETADGIKHSMTSDFYLEQLPGGYETIPEEHLLVLGDNRENSTDSRMLGLISMDQIVGKASLIYWPLDRIQIIPNQENEGAG